MRFEDVCRGEIYSVRHDENRHAMFHENVFSEEHFLNIFFFKFPIVQVVEQKILKNT